MRETKYYCDVCKKEMSNVYYKIGVDSREGFITKPVPNNVECCSIVCVQKWIGGNLKKEALE